MAAPHPPQGAQQQYTERPIRIYGEQYLAGGALPIGVVIDPVGAGGPIYSDGQPRVLLPDGWVVIQSTEWIITNRYTGAAVEVISAEEFAERFGPGGGPALGGEA
jgi:hypothetical protein